MAVVVSVLKARGLTVFVRTQDTILFQTPDHTIATPQLVIEAAGQRDKCTTQLHLYQVVEGIHENPDFSLEIDRRVHLMRACLERFGPELYNRTVTPLSLRVRMLEADVMETLPYGCDMDP